MATTLDTLEKRLTALEQEVASLRQDVHGRARQEKADQGNQQTISAAIAKAFKALRCMLFITLST